MKAMSNAACQDCIRWDVAGGAHGMDWQHRELGRCCNEDSERAGKITVWWWDCPEFEAKEDEEE